MKPGLCMRPLSLSQALCVDQRRNGGRAQEGPAAGLQLGAGEYSHRPEQYCRVPQLVPGTGPICHPSDLPHARLSGHLRCLSYSPPFTNLTLPLHLLLDLTSVHVANLHCRADLVQMRARRPPGGRIMNRIMKRGRKWMIVTFPVWLNLVRFGSRVPDCSPRDLRRVTAGALPCTYIYGKQE